MDYIEFLHYLEIDGYSIKPTTYSKDSIPYYRIQGGKIIGLLHGNTVYFDTITSEIRPITAIVLPLPKDMEEYNWLRNQLINMDNGITYRSNQITKYPE